jgi:hypothetical protein
MTITQVIITFVKRDYRYLGCEQASGWSRGKSDVLLENPEGQATKVEVEGSSYVKDHKIIQGILYHELSQSVVIVSRNEIIEPEPWFVDAVKSVATEVSEFLQEFPEEAARIFIPHRDLCPRCSNEMCSRSCSNHKH